MKTKSSVLVLAAVVFAPVASLLHGAPPNAAASPAPAEASAQQKVRTEILAKVSTWGRGGRFSRALPTPSHRLEFQPKMLVNNESRLPFTITRWTDPKATPEWQGYVRLTDQEIFLLNPKTGKHYPARDIPRFAPAPEAVPSKPL